MDIYKLKFTRLQNEIIRFLCINSGKSFNLRRMALNLKVSLTAVSKALKLLNKEGLVKITKDKESKQLSIELNKENKKIFSIKRIENLKLIYESKIVEFLSEKFPAATIILFGSYSYGEDTLESDIDIAILGAKEKIIDLANFENALKRPITLHCYKTIKSINENLRNNIINGIVLEGGIR